MARWLCLFLLATAVLQATATTTPTPTTAATATASSPLSVNLTAFAIALKREAAKLAPPSTQNSNTTPAHQLGALLERAANAQGVLATNVKAAAITAALPTIALVVPVVGVQLLCLAAFGDAGPPFDAGFIIDPFEALRCLDKYLKNEVKWHTAAAATAATAATAAPPTTATTTTASGRHLLANTTTAGRGAIVNLTAFTAALKREAAKLAPATPTNNNTSSSMHQLGALLERAANAPGVLAKDAGIAALTGVLPAIALVVPVVGVQLLCLAAFGDAGPPFDAGGFIDPFEAFRCLTQYLNNARQWRTQLSSPAVADVLQAAAAAAAAGRHLLTTTGAATAATTTIDGNVPAGTLNLGAALPRLNFTAVVAKLRAKLQDHDDGAAGSGAAAAAAISAAAADDDDRGLHAFAQALADAVAEATLDARERLEGIETAAKLAVLAPFALTFAGVPLLCFAAYGDAYPAAAITPVVAFKCLAKVLARVAAASHS